MEAAGFTHIEVSLEEAPVSFSRAPAYAEFVSCVCLRHHLARLDPARQNAFVDALTRLAEADDPPLTLDYWRLNIDARRNR